MSRKLYKRVAPHNQRVTADGGVTTNNMNDLLLLQRSNEELKDYLKVAFCPELYGSNIRVSGINNFITKGYSKDSGANNDFTQTSSTNQPYLDKISPAEKLSAKNPNGGSNYLTHPTISFGANDEWTVETTLNSNANTTESTLAGGVNGLIGLRGISDRNIFVRNEASTTVASTINFDTYCGKNTHLCFVAKGNGTVGIYINGTYIQDINIPSNVSFNRLLNSSTNSVFGTISSHHIFSKALSPQEVATRSSMLRSIFPEIPFTRIGEQIWSVRNFEAVATPQGNLIAEMKADGNVEKVVNGGFDSDASWTKQAGWSISGGLATHTGATADSCIYQSAASNGKWYKVTFTITNYISGSCRAAIAGKRGITRNNVGTYTDYILCSGAAFCGVNVESSFEGSIDNVSVQEIGWSGSQELYDGIYAQTEGTVEQKTYAAVKAAGFWCHYNNSVDNGAIYGKLYNWFAVKLLQMDIDYYNAANPSTPWGWRVPTQADFQTLSTYLGGYSVAGGKLKLTGTTYWNSPNTGATNESGFSAIGGGRRNADGSFVGFSTETRIWTVDSLTATTAFDKRLVPQDSTFNDDSRLKTLGLSFRLIKTN